MSQVDFGRFPYVEKREKFTKKKKKKKKKKNVIVTKQLDSVKHITSFW